MGLVVLCQVSWTQSALVPVSSMVTQLFDASVDNSGNDVPTAPADCMGNFPKLPSLLQWLYINSFSE